jgi:hypothetical protein
VPLYLYDDAEGLEVNTKPGRVSSTGLDALVQFEK